MSEVRLFLEFLPYEWPYLYIITMYRYLMHFLLFKYHDLECIAYAPPASFAFIFVVRLLQSPLGSFGIRTRITRMNIDPKTRW